MSTGTTARAAIVRNMNEPWVIEEVQIAVPRDNEVLVPMPIVLGHEGAGVVEQVGAAVTKVKVGDHVVLSFDSCGECRNCEHDQPAYCFTFYPRNLAGVRVEDGSATVTQDGVPINASFFCQSSFATYAIAREVNTVVIDKDLPLAIIGPLGCGVQTGTGAAVNALGVKDGASLAIFGGGAVGLSALLGARAVGAGTVTVVEPNAGRRAIALELGATHVIDPKATPDVLAKIKELVGGVHYALDTTDIPAVIAAAVEALFPRGMVGLPIEELQSAIRDCRKVVIARVQGFAIGGGNVFCTICDLTLASEKAVFGQVGPKVGSVDPGFGTAYLARIVGEKKAREIWFLCRKYTAQQAMDMGLVNKFVPHAELDAECEAWAAEINQMSPTAIAIAKRSFNADSENIRGISFMGVAAVKGYYQSEESKEGVRAFNEKRKPDFKKFA